MTATIPALEFDDLEGRLIDEVSLYSRSHLLLASRILFTLQTAINIGSMLQCDSTAGWRTTSCGPLQTRTGSREVRKTGNGLLVISPPATS